jgi:microcystin-dependent protein
MEGTIAEIRMFAGNFAPRNWAFCAGALMSIAQNTALFSLLGTTFGGDGRTTFGLPDLRGRVPVGTGTGPGLPNVTLGETGGSNTVTLLTTQMPMHNHVGGTLTGNPSMMVSSGNASQSAATAGASIATPGTVSSRVFSGTLGFNTSAPDIALNAGSASLAGVSVTTGVNGGSQPHDNMQPYLGMNYIICLYGIFPSRN